jgi:serine/threonine protein kinase
MRGDRVDYGLPLFREETQILSLMRDVQGITPLLECGFIQLDPGQELPSDTRHLSAEELSGTVLRYAPEEVLGFLSELEKKSHAGWLPYLAVEKYLQSDNLIQYCDTGHNHGRFLPLDALLSMAIQICDILEIAHARNIVYRDHKILHYYWLEPHNGIFIIDWNVAKRHPHGLSAEEKQFDLVQFGARALHHIFTGRPAPGALPLGPTRPDEIEAAAHTYKPQWTYDDLRLPTVLKEILEKILAGGYTQVRSLRYDLFQVYQQLSSTNI